jgi:hypothetical protein
MIMPIISASTYKTQEPNGHTATDSYSETALLIYQCAWELRKQYSSAHRSRYSTSGIFAASEVTHLTLFSSVARDSSGSSIFSVSAHEGSPN